MKPKTQLRLLAAALLLLAGQTRAQNSSQTENTLVLAQTNRPADASNFSAEALGGHITESGARKSEASSRFDDTDWQYQQSQDFTGRTIVGAVLGDAIGIVAGGLLGRAISTIGGCNGDDFCDFAGLVLGATVGSTIMSSLGAHIGNHGHGSFALTTLATVGATAAAIAGLAASQGNTAFMLTIPVAQIVTAVVVERKTGGRAKRKRN